MSVTDFMNELLEAEPASVSDGGTEGTVRRRRRGAPKILPDDITRVGIEVPTETLRKFDALVGTRNRSKVLRDFIESYVADH